MWQACMSQQILRDKVNERAVRILLECILVMFKVFFFFIKFYCLKFMYTVLNFLNLVVKTRLFFIPFPILPGTCSL